MSEEHVRNLMGRAFALPYGEARTVLTEEALRRAEATGDAALTFQVRMELGQAYQSGGEPIKTFTTFSRALADFDRAPGELDDSAEQRLLWQFKWIVHSLTLFPEVPLDRTRAVLADMERRYTLGGHSLHAVYARRARVAMHLGDADDAAHWYAKWNAAPRDGLSDCEGCDPTGKAAYLAWRGRDADALAVAAPVLSAELDCTEQPQTMLTALLPIYLRTGRLDEARTAHLRAYRLIRTQISELGEIADHVEFCARTGNEVRGLEIVQRHLPWLDRAPSPFDAMRFAAASALLLGRMAGAGHGGHTVARRPGEDRPIVAVAAELAAQATELAALFDARNGTSAQGDRVRELLGAEPVVEHLPLLAVPGRRTVRPPAPSAPDMSDVTEPGAALDRAEDAWRRDDVPAALAAWRRFDALAGEVTPLDAARRADGRGVEAIAGGDPEAAVAAWRRAAELYAEAGDLERHHAASSRVGGLHEMLGRLDLAFPLLTAAVEYLSAHAAVPGRAVGARLRLATAHVAADDPAAALAVLAGAVPGDASDTALVALLRGRILAGTGDQDAAVAQWRAASAAAREAGIAGLRAEASLLLGATLAQLGHLRPDGHEERFAAALDALDEAVEHAGDALTRASAHAERGDLLLSRERPADAAPDLAEAVAGYTALADADHATRARIALASAYYGAGRHLEAAEVAEQAAADVAALDDRDAERRCRLLVAHARRELGEEQAADAFAELAELARGDGDPNGTAYLLEQSAEILTAHDRDDVAAGRFTAAADTYVVAGDPYGTVRTLRRAALCHWWDADGEAALTALTRSRAALTEIPADNAAALTWETALVDYDGARILAGLGRVPEALASVEAAIAGFTELDEPEAAAHAARLRDDLRSSFD
ncbi:hypothetical protein BTM25_16230 [Actinomadura rubteroloni]|uniref:Tetratricopeptide repeat protein n=1 Tax=Actinomadura rubteroloni TaxID=1926885 RepID=A0A2P4UQ93_9ACTN|nr:hypothetical protein [Actinomadura rubteroloni]POM27212.1 hypothetical protein BTM25_16230 [Actinomadura rubteroloni]